MVVWSAFSIIVHCKALYKNHHSYNYCFKLLLSHLKSSSPYYCIYTGDKGDHIIFKFKLSDENNYVAESLPSRVRMVEQQTLSAYCMHTLVHYLYISFPLMKFKNKCANKLHFWIVCLYIWKLILLLNL